MVNRSMEKMFNITTNQGDLNKNHKEVSVHSNENGYNEKVNK
jgi:hypothetical protein